MPSLQDIRDFNSSLVRLADEERVVREWGEEIEDLPEPEEGLDNDLSSLLADTGDLSETAEAEDTEAAAAEPEFADTAIDDLLSDEVAEPPADEGFELPEPEIPLQEPIEETPERPDEPVEEVPADDVDFSDFEALLSDEPFGQPPPDDEATPEQPAGQVDENLFDDEVAADFLETEPAEEDAEEDADEPQADFEAAADEFELPSDADFDFGAELTEPPAEQEPVESEPGEAEEPAEVDLGETDFESETPGDDFDAFSADDEFTFEDEDLGSEPAGEPAAETDIDSPEADAEAETEAADFDLGAYEFSDEDDGLPNVPTSDDGAFEEPRVPGAEPEFEEPEIGGETEEAEPVEELEEIDTSGIDEFSLGDFGAEFGVLQDEVADTEEDLNPALSVPDVAPLEVVTGAGSFDVSDDDFEHFKRNLRALPLNVKVEVETIVTEAKGTTDEVEKLVRRIAAGDSAMEIAGTVSRIVGRQIRIPRGYEKRSGLEFETERRSFAYQFRENILPILRLVAVVVLGIGLLALAGYHLVYRPLYARSLYREGLALIDEDQYGLGNQNFLRAREVWRNDRWFYEYAERFIDERQFGLAAEKYEQLLFGMSNREREFYLDLLSKRQFGSIILEREPDKQAVLDYAAFQSEYLENYERADLVLQLILHSDVTDYEGWLAVGDNNMEWARRVPSRYEDARIAYAKLLERYGQSNELLFRMLTYFVRTDNLTEVLRLKETFQDEERVRVDPVRYSEMAGYLIDKGSLDDIEDVLFRVLDVEPTLPDVHYQLARYYRAINIPGSEEIALQNALRFLEETRPLDGEHLGKLVDTHTRIGENYYDADFFLEAQESFSEAIAAYESGLNRRVLEPDAVYGRAYARLADILYYEGRQYDDAFVFLNKAEANLYDEPNLDYKQGFVLYRNGQVDSALTQFKEAAQDPSAATNALLWATANTYYRRGNYYAAEAYYRELLDRVELQRDNIRHLLVDEDDSHRSVIEYLIRVNNNLGVTLSRQHNESGDPDVFASALINLTESIEYSENYARDPDTLTRSEAVGLPFLNQRGILYPTPDFALQIYTDLPHDLDDLVF